MRRAGRTKGRWSWLGLRSETNGAWLLLRMPPCRSALDGGSEEFGGRPNDAVSASRRIKVKQQIHTKSWSNAWTISFESPAPFFAPRPDVVDVDDDEEVEVVEDENKSALPNIERPGSLFSLPSPALTAPAEKSVDATRFPGMNPLNIVVVGEGWVGLVGKHEEHEQSDACHC